ncbi:hypothetical protein QJS10_CPB18g00613 [Acorus calamus]|uniref:Uncharacterized protein n=1 Tax=Acorus calamus TaxID=4465 RepID=A0AAV9CNN2_ACOCL|nr:hypothetical protein QJS10_CPB18g00613 [Acorus calamus]
MLKERGLLNMRKVVILCLGLWWEWLYSHEFSSNDVTIGLSEARDSLRDEMIVPRGLLNMRKVVILCLGLWWEWLYSHEFSSNDVTIGLSEARDSLRDGMIVPVLRRIINLGIVEGVVGLSAIW